MAITTLDGVIAGLKPPQDFLKVGGTMEAAGVHYSYAYTSGRPGAIAASTAGLSGEALTTLSGQIPWSNPVSGNSYIGRLQASCSGSAGALILYDRLWQNSGIVVTTTTSQTIDSVAWPARDRDGSTDGVNILVGIEVRTATTNAAAITNTTMTYTNSAGTGSKTATISSFPATAVAGTFVPFQLAAGDVGVRSIQSITLGTSYGGGAIHLVAYRILGRLEMPILNTGNSIDALTGGFVQCYDNTVPMLLWLASATTAASINGHLIIAQG